MVLRTPPAQEATASPAGEAPPDRGIAYLRIEEELNARIASGELEAGQLIPSERELARRLGVSRSTVREALGRLEHRGLVVREQGRGTFVARPKIRHSTDRLRSHFDQMVGQGLIPMSRVLRRTETFASRANAMLLGLRVGEPIYKLVRLRFANGEPVAISTSLFPASVLPGILDVDIEHLSLYRLMDERYGARPVRAVQSIEPMSAGANEASLLGVAPGAPLLIVERTSWDARGRTVEHARDIHRGDRSRFVGELRP